MESVSIHMGFPIPLDEAQVHQARLVHTLIREHGNVRSSLRKRIISENYDGTYDGTSYMIRV